MIKQYVHNRCNNKHNKINIYLKLISLKIISISIFIEKGVDICGHMSIRIFVSYFN